jgi:hypothetical protein
MILLQSMLLNSVFIDVPTWHIVAWSLSCVKELLDLIEMRFDLYHEIAILKGETIYDNFTDLFFLD